MQKKKPNQFNCFSPPVMLATLIIEFSIAFYTLWRYKMTAYTRLIIGVLVSLAIFQVAEYFVCTGLGVRPDYWSRLGYVSISLLPPLGLHLMHVLADKPKRLAVRTAYATFALCSLYFVFYHGAFASYQCTGNYVIFQLGDNAAFVHGVYYYVWLLTSIVLGSLWIREFKRKTDVPLQKIAVIKALIIGYLVFILPVAAVYSINPEALHGIPSIMCGFAVLLAVILGFYILPRVGERRAGKPASKND